MAYIVSGADLTSVANAIRTAGETSAPLEFPSGFVNAIGNISGGGGGATNFVKGTFTPTTSEKNSVKSITVPYTGNGFPVACLIYPSGGYNSELDIYNSTQYHADVLYCLLKSNMTAPVYGTSNTENNWALIIALYKSSSSDATSLQTSFSRGKIALTSYNPPGNDATSVVRFNSATQMNVFIKESAYGFLAETEYEYLILYSE